MGTSIQRSSLARRGLTAVAGLAVVAGTLVGIAVPASAAAGDGVATAASVDDSRWLVGTTKAVTVSWTNSVETLTSVLARSPWPWGAAWTADGTGFASTGGVASGAQTSRARRTAWRSFSPSVAPPLAVIPHASTRTLLVGRAYGSKEAV